MVHIRLDLVTMLRSFGTLGWRKIETSTISGRVTFLMRLAHISRHKFSQITIRPMRQKLSTEAFLPCGHSAKSEPYSTLSPAIAAIRPRNIAPFTTLAQRNAGAVKQKAT